ncbi:hypothetical protein K0B03_04535 [Patescibacteria group bacterium]|nr:hypothetical protein [Patescibacteria group bacterium]
MKLFNIGKKKDFLNTLSQESLITEQQQLENDERYLMKMITHIEAEKEMWLEKMGNAKNEREKEMFQRKAQQIELKINNEEEVLSAKSKRIVVVNNLLLILRKRSELEKSGVWKKLNQLDKIEIQDILFDQKIDEAMFEKNLNEILVNSESDVGQFI